MHNKVVSIDEVVCHIRGIYTEHNVFIHSIAKQGHTSCFVHLKTVQELLTQECAMHFDSQNLNCKNSSLIFAL